ncbi:MAG: hypothetical protein K2X49_19720 [Acetobacteraceae bacterium]|nr:hypothetical protein [Acetobacteraceae bacterium]
MLESPKQRARPEKPVPHERRLALLGVRMTEQRLIEVKVEAARRGMSVADLFDDVWNGYLAGRAER